MGLLEATLSGNRRWIRLGDVYEITRKPRALMMPAMIPFAPMEAIPEGGHLKAQFAEKSIDQMSSGTYFERGDILVAKITPSFENGKQALTTDLWAPFGFATTEVIPLHPKDANRDRRFLFFYLLHPDVRSFIAEKMEGATGRQRVPERALLDLPIPEMSSADEASIAATLGAVQDGMANEMRAFENGQKLKGVTLRALFTRGLRAEAQKETEVGPTPESWNRESLGDCAEITYGAQAAVAHATDPSIGTLILTNINISSDGAINLDKKRYYQVPEQHRERLLLKKGDVLFNWRSGSASHVGKTAIFDLDGEFTYSSFILRFRPRRSVSSQFLFRVLSHMRSEGFFLTRRNVSSINSVFNASLAATIPIWFPPPEEQQDISDLLCTIDRKIEVHQGKYGVLANLFNTLLHALLTGELRVSDLDLSALAAKPTEVSA